MTAVDLAKTFEEDTSADTSEYLSKMDEHYSSLINGVLALICHGLITITMIIIIITTNIIIIIIAIIITIIITTTIINNYYLKSRELR